MEQIMIGASAQKSSSRPRAAAATVADVMRPPVTTVGQHDHAAAAAYLMKHAGATALMVVNTQTGQPVGIVTEADVAHAIADGKDLNEAWVDAVMTTRPAVTTATSIRHAARIMTTRHLRHLPVAGDAGLLGVVDLTAVCRALLNARAGATPLPDPRLTRSASGPPEASPSSCRRPGSRLTGAATASRRSR